jgi:elongation factor Tu
VEFPQYEFDENGPFLMPIDDVFAIKQRGCVVVGTIVRGDVRKGDSVEIVGLQQQKMLTIIAGTEMVQSDITALSKRDWKTAAFLLRRVTCNQLQAGMVLAAPGTINVWNSFVAYISVTPSNLGGRSNAFRAGYEPKLILYNRPYVCRLTLPDDIDEVMPGDLVRLTIDLDAFVALEEGTQITLKERHKVVAVGVVSELLR